VSVLLLQLKLLCFFSCFLPSPRTLHCPLFVPLDMSSQIGLSLSLFLGVVERCCCERRRSIRLAHCVNPPDGTVCLEGAPRSKNHPGAYNGSKQAGKRASGGGRTDRPTDQQTPMTVNDKQQKKRKMAAATAAVDFTSSHQPYGVFPPSLPFLCLCTPFLLLLLLSPSSS